MASLRQNTWTLDEWYAQDVAGNAEELIEGQWWVWGAAEDGSLGLNEESINRSSPTQIPGTTWSLSGHGTNFQRVTKSDGTLWTFGPNEDGRIDHNDRTSRSSPTQVGTDATWKRVLGTYSSCMAVKTDGTLWTWGNGGAGNLGLNTSPGTKSFSSPCQVGTDNTWDLDTFTTGIGHKHMLAVKTDGSLWSWGENEHPQLGQNNKTYYSSPKQEGTATTWALGENKIVGGYSSTAAIKTDGTLWTWGTNATGQLGTDVPAYTDCSSPKQVGSATYWDQVWMGHGASYAFKTDGTLWVWGENAQGCLAVPLPQYPQISTSPRQVGTDTNWSKMIIGSKVSASIKSDGSLWTWGNNESGTLGLNNRTDYASPKQVGTDTNWADGWGGEKVIYARKHNPG